MGTQASSITGNRSDQQEFEITFERSKERSKMGRLGEVWAAETDLETRDPNSLNDHLKVTFEEALGEPDHTHALDCVWKYSYKCFNFCKALCYLIATTLCGIPMAICWGCYFACVAFCHIWQITPSIRALDINCSIYKRMATIYVGACAQPCCESCGTMFNAFKK